MVYVDCAANDDWPTELASKIGGGAPARDVIRNVVVVKLLLVL